jgi:GlpG protein
MRAIGAVPTEQDARRLSSYLLILGISSHCDPSHEGYCIWIRDEDQLQRARQELAAFLANPTDTRYDDAIVAAEQIRAQQTKAHREYQRNVIDMRSRWRRPVPQGCPLTIGLIAVCVLVAALSRLGKQNEPVLSYLFMTRPFEVNGREVMRTDLPEIRQGQLWRLVTPIFIHFNWWHILFNLWNLYSLGGVFEITRGKWKLALFVLFTGAFSNVAQFLWSGPGFGGMSGVLFALFGYIWMKSRYDPSAGVYLNPDTVTLMIGFLLICMTGILGNIANAAHVGGLVAGVAIGIAPVLWRKFVK